MCPPREKVKNKKRNKKRGKPTVNGRGSGRGLEMNRRPNWGLRIRLLITFLHKPGRAVINADELTCLQITDSGVPLTLGITRLP